MRAETENRMNGIWYGEDPSPLWLRGLVPAYRVGQKLDRWWQLRHQPKDLTDACIVVVGNLSVGGSGKTPLVVRLCRLLREAGLQAGVISRGYGRSEKRLRLVSAGSDPGEVGDEPLLIAQQAGVPVIVSPDRCAAARALFKKGVQVVISDDGLQHYRLPRKIEICVIDGHRGFGNGQLLPAGPLREPTQRLHNVDHVVINGDLRVPLPELETAGLQPAQMTLAAGLLRPLEGGQNWRLSQFGGCRVNAVAGIGNPQRFFELLRGARITVTEHIFPDHHLFSRDDFARMDPDLPILMTEKDAVKCRKLGLVNAWFLSVDAVLPAEWEAGLLQELNGLLKSKGSRPRR
jgi:tetraacyldisaccharide 4'-kinase